MDPRVLFIPKAFDLHSPCRGVIRGSMAQRRCSCRPIQQLGASEKTKFLGCSPAWKENAPGKERLVDVVITNPAGETVAGPASLPCSLTFGSHALTYAQVQSLVEEKGRKGTELKLLKGDQVLAPSDPILPPLDDGSTIPFTVVWYEIDLLNDLDQSVLDELARKNCLKVPFSNENGISVYDSFSGSNSDGDTTYGRSECNQYVLVSDGRAFYKYEGCESESRCEDVIWRGSTTGSWIWSDAKKAVAECNWKGPVRGPSKLDVFKFKGGCFPPSGTDVESWLEK